MSPALPFQHLAAELRLYSGDDCLVALARELRRHGCRRAVLVCGRTVAGTDAMALLRAALAPVLAGESTAVRPNSPLSAVVEVARTLGALQADAVVAVGGGSAAVTARAATILLAECRPAQALCTRRLPDGRFDSPRLDAAKLPQFVVPTTPSTAFVKAGSAVHDDASGQRLALFDPKTRAKAVFLHPGLLRTAPAGLVLGNTLNTLCTAVEALESPRCDPVSEAMLRHALRLVMHHLGNAERGDGRSGLASSHTAAREELAVAAVLCGRGTEQAGGGLASVLAHAIGHRCQVANGIVNTIVLPHTLRFNAPATLQTAERIAQSLSAEAAVGSAAPSAAERAATAVVALSTTLALPQRLRDIGIAQADLDAIAQAAMADWFITRSARPVLHAGELRAILDAAW